MRTYGYITTMIIVGMLMPHILWFTKMDLVEMLFVTAIFTMFAGLIFGLVTEPRKRKSAKWEKAGDLEVLVMETGGKHGTNKK